MTTKNDLQKTEQEKREIAVWDSEKDKYKYNAMNKIVSLVLEMTNKEINVYDDDCNSPNSYIYFNCEDEVFYLIDNLTSYLINEKRDLYFSDTFLCGGVWEDYLKFNEIDINKS
jgi:hypothetical protein